MTHSVISHENSTPTTLNNSLNTNTTPFLARWKSATLAQAKLLGIPLESTANIDFKVLANTIEARLIARDNSVNSIELSVNINNHDKPALVPSYYLCDEYKELCNKYHIPFKAVYHSYKELDAAEELVAEYVDLLKTARNLGLYWDESNYDPEALQELIDEYHSEESDHGYFAESNSDYWAYYSKLGV